MDKALEKMARQLMAYDEASLASLWEKYAARVQHFEPTRKWEETALVFGMIQAMRWKNQLFNYHWKESADSGDLPLQGPELMSKPPFPSKGPGAAPEEPKGAKILKFDRKSKDKGEDGD